MATDTEDMWATIDSFQVCNFTCFKENYSGFTTIKPINLIIGRNNTGKSHLLDIVETLCTNGWKGKPWHIQGSMILSEQQLKLLFSPNTNGGFLGGNHWTRHGINFVSKRVSWEKKGKDNIIVNLEGLCDDDYNISDEAKNARRKIIIDLISRSKHWIAGKSFRRLLADRDIRPEPESPELALAPDGVGATNIIRKYINSSNLKYNQDLIRVDLLQALQSAFGKDGHFTDILVKCHDEPTPLQQANTWEVYLHEENKGLIPLSQSGSGLKTIILVLLNLLIVPDFTSTKRSDILFAFEELENNLHPSLLRRLLSYIRDYVRDHEATVFITTHSSVALDLLGTEDNSQIIHVTHDGYSASAKTISAHFDKVSVLSEIGARPSDLLQANGIIWVEGPSDRIYINRWIDLISEGKFREGVHYQCAFYGGSLLARVQTTDPGVANPELVNLVSINPNLIMVCDSDQHNPESAYKLRVNQISDQVSKIPNSLLWITEAKEIENYIPGTVFGSAFERTDVPDPTKHQAFFPSSNADNDCFWIKHQDNRTFDKVKLASKCVPFMSKVNMSGRFDWQEKMGAIIGKIESWNNH